MPAKPQSNTELQREARRRLPLPVAAAVLAALPAAGLGGLAAATARTAVREIGGPRLAALSPSPAVPGLPLFLSGTQISLAALREVTFVQLDAAAAGRAAGSHSEVVRRPGAVRDVEPGRELSVVLPALRPGDWSVRIVLSGQLGTTNAKTLRVVAPSAVRRGAACPKQWLSERVDGLVCRAASGGARWQVRRTGSDVLATSTSSTTSTTSTTEMTTTTLGAGATQPADPPAGGTTSTSPPSTTAGQGGAGATAVTASFSGDPSRGATTGTVLATVSTSPPGSAPVTPAAGTITFTVASRDAYQSLGTLVLTTRAAGQTSCQLDYQDVYVEQEDPSALGAPDGWRGEVSGGGDCAVSETGGVGPTGASGAGTGAAQLFLTGLSITASYTAAGASSPPDVVAFDGPATVPVAIVGEHATQPGCDETSCLVVWPNSGDYVGEVTEGSLVVQSAGGWGCPASTLYDGPVPGVGVTPPATVTVPAPCSGVSAAYAPPASPVAGEGGEPITFEPASINWTNEPAGTSLELAAGSTVTYPPSIP